MGPTAPPMTAEEAEIARVAREEKLQVFSQVIAARLKEAITGKESSGVEMEWEQDEEAYEGVDDANRADAAFLRTKPYSDGTNNSRSTKEDTGSTVFLNITRPYVDASAARVGDMLLPTDDWPWSIKPTPMPEIDGAADAPDAGQEVMLPDGRTGQKAALAEVLIKEAARRSAAGEKRIQDWQVESQWHAETRKVIEDAARLGTGILKGPFPVKKQSRSWVKNTDGTTQLDIKQTIVPASKRIDPRNLYPDPGCGENIHNGNYVFEKDRITAKQLRDLRGVPGYLDWQIGQAIKEGPKLSGLGSNNDSAGRHNSEKDQYDIWYYHGVVDSAEMNAIGCPCREGESAFALITMVNDRVIKAVLNPLDTGEFPYDVMVWQRRSGTWTGIGVSRQIRVPQRMVNAGSRNLMDNAGLGSGPQIILKDGSIFPADGVWQIRPRGIWKVSAEAEGPVSDYFHTEVIPMIQPELMAIIQFALKMAEDVTGLPMLMQGQQGKAPETVGGMQLLNNNASSVLRRIARLFDDLITEPHIRRYYNWLMQYSDDPEEKGDFQINAVGSSALVERDIQNQEITQMGQIVLNPVFGLDPKKWISEYLKSRRFDPERFKFTEEEEKQNQVQAQEQAQSQPVDPRVAGSKEVATIRTQGEMQKAQLVQQSDMAELRFKAEQAQLERQHDKEMQQLEYQMKLMEFSQQQGLNLDQAKVKLSETSMKLRTQLSLSMGKNAPQVVSPPTEPAGQAPPGQAFQK